MDFNALAKETWRVGREKVRAMPEHAFDIKRRDDGGITMSNLQAGLTDAERTRLMTHFGSPIDAMVGTVSESEAEDGTEHRTPGTVEHFVCAVHRLPPPFILLPKE